MITTNQKYTTVYLKKNIKEIKHTTKKIIKPQKEKETKETELQELKKQGLYGN